MGKKLNKILIDTLPIKLQLTEDKKKGKVIARGEYAKFSEPTENKRFYPLKLWEKNIAELKDNIAKRRIFGELDHPGDGKTKLQRVSHLLTSLQIDEGNGSIIGESEILDTPSGKILKELFKAGCEIGISSRGFGSTNVNKEGIEIVDEDYKLMTFDFVADPATKDAYPDIFIEEKKILEADMELNKEILQKDYPGLYREIKSQIKNEVIKEQNEIDNITIENITKEVKEKTEKEMKEVLADQLVKEIEKIKDEAKNKVKDELLSDPEVGLAKTAIESIIKIVEPFMVCTEDNDILQAKDKRIAEMGIDINNLRNELKETVNVAKKATYKLFLERLIKDYPEEKAKVITDLVGDITSFANTEEIGMRVESIVDEFDRVTNEIENKIENESYKDREGYDSDRHVLHKESREKDREINLLRSKNSKLEKKNNELEEAILNVKDLAEEMKLQVYAERKLNGLPNVGKLRSLLKNAKDENDIDEIIESNKYNRHDNEEMEKIRARISKGKERSLSEEEGSSNNNNNAKLFGVSLNEIAKIAGIEN